MCLGVTRPFLLSLAAFPANSRISAGEKVSPFQLLQSLRKINVLFSIHAKRYLNYIMLSVTTVEYPQ